MQTKLKRPIKKIQNFFRDPLPRNRELVFENYDLCFPDIVIIYRVGEKRYENRVQINLPVDELSILNREEHHSFFVNIGLSFATSHFLISDFDSVRCECAYLDKQDIELLERQFLHSLTEFRYMHGLDPSRPVHVVSSGTTPLNPVSFKNAPEKALLLNGGGKDSCVAAELLKAIGLSYGWMSAFPNTPRRKVIEQSGCLENYSIMIIPSNEIKKDKVYQWGLTPYLYTIASTSLIVCYLKGFRYMVTGVEHSADDPNLIFKGIPVNHQSGKTSIYENFFYSFVKKSILKNLKMFSIARPFTDFRLAEIISHFPKYFTAFCSCNVGVDKWCNNCHKCAFTYMALYPFLKMEYLVKIFGKDLFTIPIIRKYMIEIATARIKPWECVGTIEETKLALLYCLRKAPDMEFNEWPKRNNLEKVCNDIDENSAYNNSLAKFHEPHNIPEQFEKKLKDFTDNLLKKSFKKQPEIFN